MALITPSDIIPPHTEDTESILDLGLPRFSLDELLFIASFRTRFPISFPVRVAYLLPLRKDGTFHYFVMPRDAPVAAHPPTDAANLPADLPAGAWVHETDLSPEPPAHRTMTLKVKKG